MEAELMSERTALVVGGTSGIGLATARQLSEAGARVHIAGRGKEQLDRLAVSDPGLTGHQADGADRGQIAAVAEVIGRIDWLVITLGGREGAGPVAASQQADGGWTFDFLAWSPGQLAEWRGIVTLGALLTLGAHGRIKLGTG
jgi:NAD(P)-dependent dehydrogenase (short-subunit alcohol dehydrogenase family)